MKNVYTVIIKKDEDGYYVGSIPALPGCHAQAGSIDQLMERMKEAIALWFEVPKAPRPQPASNCLCFSHFLLQLTRRDAQQFCAFCF